MFLIHEHMDMIEIQGPHVYIIDLLREIVFKCFAGCSVEKNIMHRVIFTNVIYFNDKLFT